jgi:hypothetical protein
MYYVLMDKGYQFSAKTQQEIKKSKETIKAIRDLQWHEVVKALFRAIKDSDRGKGVKKENKELGEQMQKDRESVAWFIAENDKFDTKENELIQELEWVRKVKELLQKNHAPRIAELKSKLWLTESVEELQEALKQYILQKSAAIAHEVRENNQFVDREVGNMEDVFPNNDNQKALERKDVHFVGNPLEKDMNSWDKLLIQPMMLDGVEYTALKIPSSVKEMKVLDLSSQFMDKQGNDWFPQMDMNVSAWEALWSEWLVLEKNNTKADNGKTKVNIQAYNKSADTDVVRECLLKGIKPMGIVQTLVLREIIKQWLWDEYVNFQWYKADSDQPWYQDIREKITKIDDFLGINFADYNSNGDIIRTRWIYRDKNNNINAFIRGAGDADGCLGGVASLGLYCSVAYGDACLGFRSCV